MSLLMQLTINGAIAGSIYALIASGFSLIYGTNKFMHFAHGAAVSVAGYSLFYFFSSGLKFYQSVLVTLILAGAFGFFIYKIIYLPLQNRNASNIVLLVASIALLILFENLIQIIFGANVSSINYLEVKEGFDFLGASITGIQIIIIGVSLLLLFSLYLFMKKTSIGKVMRAVADNKELAAIGGIDPVKIANYSFILGSLLAGVAGILIGLEQSLTPGMGTSLIIKGFTGAVIGGITSVPASILGSYILGFAENYGIAFLSSGYKDAIAFVILFIFLLLKPNGLFGINQGVKNV